jgi:hypothetical protein
MALGLVAVPRPLDVVSNTGFSYRKPRPARRARRFWSRSRPGRIRRAQAAILRLGRPVGDGYHQRRPADIPREATVADDIGNLDCDKLSLSTLRLHGTLQIPDRT